MGDPRKVLSIEDDESTIAGLLNDFDDHGVEVHRESELDAGEKAINEEKYDLILVDLRVFRGKREAVDGGAVFLKRLIGGEIGEMNRDTPACMLTAFVNDAIIEEVIPLVPVLGKAPNIVEDLALVLGDRAPWLWELRRPAQTDQVVDDLVRIESHKPDTVVIYVGAWPNGDRLEMRKSELDDSVLQELEYGRPHIWAWAKVNISAEKPEDVRPHEFRIVDEDSRFTETFDRGQIR